MGILTCEFTEEMLFQDADMYNETAISLTVDPAVSREIEDNHFNFTKLKFTWETIKVNSN